MRTATKVFIWIGMIIGFILIYPLVVGIFALNKLEEAESSKDLQTMGVLTLLFCSLLGGIFMLSIKDFEKREVIEDKEVKKSENNTKSSPTHKEIISTERKVVKNEKYDPELENELKSNIGIMRHVTFVLIIITFVFSIISFNIGRGYDASDIINLIFSIASMCLFLLFVYITAKDETSVSAFVSNATMFLPIIFCSIVKIIDWDIVWSDIVVFGSTFISFVISTIITAYKFLMEDKIKPTKIIFQKTIKKENVATNDNNVVSQVSDMQKELQESQRLFDEKIITEDEFKRIRESIISKYYK